MNIIMSYVDHNAASIDERELFSFTSSEASMLYDRLRKDDDVLGGVLIGTCNRTELYLSMKPGTYKDPFELICEVKKQDPKEADNIKKTLNGHDAIRHLLMVSSGTESQIWGDAQIISQVRDSVRAAREEKTTDSILNVLFRNAVSAGKKVKTHIDFKISDNSTASKAVNLLKTRGDIQKVLIIGNGMIGRLVGEELVRNEIQGTMTLRQFKSGAINVPRRIDTVNYSERYEVISDFDAVISATMSPHFTLTYDEMKKLEKWPKVFIDLAIPRDIDPKITEDKTHKDLISYYDLDMISRDEVEETKDEQMYEISEIVREFEEEFYRWYDFKTSMGGI
ncbi:glutamyl-tRNA reductase [Eubacteriales bacterium KG125]